MRGTRTRKTASKLEQLETRNLMTGSVPNFIDLLVADDPIPYRRPTVGQFVVGTDSKMNALEVFSEQRVDYTLESVTAAKNGIVTIDGDGKLQYTPNPDFEGTDNFVYTININGQSESFPAHVQVVVPYIAVPDWTYAQTGRETRVDVLANDRENGGLFRIDSQLNQSSLDLRIESVSVCDQNGTLRIAEDGKTVVYTPAEGFEGLDEFHYTAIDQNGHRRSARVQVRVGEASYDAEAATHYRWEEEYIHDQIMINLDATATNLSQPVPYEISWNSSPVFLSTQSSVTSSFRLTDQVSSADSFSNTNVQVAGVDESDLIENDGEFIYWLSSRATGTDDGQWRPSNNFLIDFDPVGSREMRHELVILNANSPEQAGVVSRVQFEHQPKAMFLHEGRLTVITEASGEVGVTVLDVTDRQNPSRVESNQVTGSLDDARMVDGRLYLFVNRYESSGFSRIGFTTTSFGTTSCWGCRSYWQPTLTTTQHHLDQLMERDWLHGVVSKHADGSITTESLVDVATIARGTTASQLATWNSALWVFDTTDNDAGASSNLLLDFDPEAIYMDADSLYLTSTTTRIVKTWQRGTSLPDDGNSRLLTERKRSASSV